MMLMAPVIPAALSLVIRLSSILRRSASPMNVQNPPSHQKCGLEIRHRRRGVLGRSSSVIPGGPEEALTAPGPGAMTGVVVTNDVRPQPKTESISSEDIPGRSD